MESVIKKMPVQQQKQCCLHMSLLTCTYTHLVVTVHVHVHVCQYAHTVVTVCVHVHLQYMYVPSHNMHLWWVRLESVMKECQCSKRDQWCFAIVVMCHCLHVRMLIL